MTRLLKPDMSGAQLEMCRFCTNLHNCCDMKCYQKMPMNKKPQENKVLNTFFDAHHPLNGYPGSRPVITHRGCSKRPGEYPIIMNEMRKGNKLFYKAEHGNYGDDAFFIVQTKRYLLFGVADGVGGWGEFGINPATFSACLVKHACKNSIDIIKHIEKSAHYAKRSCEINASYLLHAAFNDLLKYDGDKVFGSATVCFGVYDCESMELNVANLGDCGFYVRNKTDFSFLSPSMMWKAGIPFQLTNLPPKMLDKYKNFTRTQDASFHKFQLCEGDYFVMGTDGVWDNVDMKQMQTNFYYENLDLNLYSNIYDKHNILNWLADNFFSEVLNNSMYPYLSRINYEARNGLYCDKFYGGKKDDISLLMVLV